jgi:hypothetical protein
MGVTRLLAKGWTLFCLFAGAHALSFSLARGEPVVDALFSVGVTTLLFAAMGLLFVGGFGAAAGLPDWRRLRPHHLIPGFDEIVFIVFVALSFADQLLFAPLHIEDGVAGAVQAAISFVVPGQRALIAALAPCGLDGGRVFASSFAWLLALVYLGSAVSRLKLRAGILRLERAQRPEALGPMVHALVLGALSVAGLQLLYVGSVFRFLPCSLYADVTGATLIGLAPLMLAYLIVAGLASAMATGKE